MFPPTPVQMWRWTNVIRKRFNDPKALGADFCRNVTLGAFTRLATCCKGGRGIPDPIGTLNRHARIKKVTRSLWCVGRRAAHVHGGQPLRRLHPGLNAGEADGF